MMTVAELIESLEKYPSHYYVTIARLEAQYVVGSKLGSESGQTVVVIDHKKA